jgi:hypothetical protein
MTGIRCSTSSGNNFETGSPGIFWLSANNFLQKPVTWVAVVVRASDVRASLEAAVDLKLSEVVHEHPKAQAAY